MKASGQDMLQIAAHELMAGEGAGLVAAGLSILVAEGDTGLVESREATIGDGDAKGIAGEIVEHPRRLGPKVGYGPPSAGSRLEMVAPRQE